jgi:hypothetical protein
MSWVLRPNCPATVADRVMNIEGYSGLGYSSVVERG